jgi:hypothetical protein
MVLKRAPFGSAVMGTARDAVVIAGRVLRSKMPKMTPFAPQKRGFRGFCDTLRQYDTLRSFPASI